MVEKFKTSSMRFFILIIALTSSLITYSQSNYIINVNSSGGIFEDVRTRYTAFSFAPGIEYNNGFSVNVGIGYVNMQSLSVYTNLYRKMDVFQSSITASKRILNGSSIISPLASVTIGSAMFSRQRGCYSNKGKVECDESTLLENPRVDKFRFFAKAKFMFDCRFSKLSFRFGPTYTFQEGRMINDPKERHKSQALDGYGLEGAIVFSLSPQTLIK